MVVRITFEEARAQRYRKVTEVLAFRSADAVTYHKQWGVEKIRAGGWVIVPLTSDGEVSANVYGVDGDVFEKTYEPSHSGNPHQYRKKETVLAYQPGDDFQVDTILKDGHVEVADARSGAADDWIVKAPGGEVYPISNAVFRRTYVEVTD